ncbi:MAG TPA: hypothetical protein VFY25_08670, partial [Anaerolineales bacterium]|nr:hypothetical protein [Anaerolineales bacterium]
MFKIHISRFGLLSTLVAVLLGSCVPAAARGVQEFAFDNVSFRFDPALAEGVGGELVPSGEMEILGYHYRLPQHVAVTFSGYYPERPLDPHTLNENVGAQIFV